MVAHVGVPGWCHHVFWEHWRASASCLVPFAAGAKVWYDIKTQEMFLCLWHNRVSLPDGNTHTFAYRVKDSWCRSRLEIPDEYFWATLFLWEFVTKIVRYIPNFSQIKAHSDDRLRNCKLTRFRLNQKEQQVADELKAILVSLHVLAFLRVDVQIVDDNNPCNKQVRCGLLQEHKSGRIRSAGH